VPLRLVAPLAVIVFAAAALAVGCGDTSIETDGSRTGTVTSVAPLPQRSSKAPPGASAKSCDSYAADAGGLRATGIGCDQARQVMYRWQRERSCALPSGASRGGCRTSSYRCQAVRTDRGTAVACARPGRSIAFVAKRG
jgi:hypothetical protein